MRISALLHCKFAFRLISSVNLLFWSFHVQKLLFWCYWQSFFNNFSMYLLFQTCYMVLLYFGWFVFFFFFLLCVCKASPVFVSVFTKFLYTVIHCACLSTSKILSFVWWEFAQVLFFFLVTYVAFSMWCDFGKMLSGCITFSLTSSYIWFFFTFYCICVCFHLNIPSNSFYWFHMPLQHEAVLLKEPICMPYKSSSECLLSTNKKNYRGLTL